jgi:hypothetical protein
MYRPAGRGDPVVFEEGGAPRSKRHSASRRRTYGRRQHELHERMDRRAERSRPDRAWRTGGEIGLDSVSYLDAPADPPFGYTD